MIKAEIVAHSKNQQGDELISVLATFPRIILAEVNTHRMLSKNTSSSRAIPFNKMVEAVQNNPFIPIAWQKEHKGMQGTEYFTGRKDIKANEKMWLHARDYAIQSAVSASKNFGITKQLCNRLLEPYMWTTMLITGSKEGWDNFFELRCPIYKPDFDRAGSYKSIKEMSAKAAGTNLFYTGLDGNRYFDGMQIPFVEALQSGLNKGQAEIHMMVLAEAIYDARNESVPKQLQPGEWHIPFENKISITSEFVDSHYHNLEDQEEENEAYTKLVIAISTAMTARTSYTVIGDEKEINYQKMIELHDRLISQNPRHSSPMEHCARAMDDVEYHHFVKGELFIENNKPKHSLGWCRNFKGFIQYRHILETNTQI